MRIGFDATAIPVNRAGAGVYIFQLIKALALKNNLHEYFVFGNSHILEEMDLDNERFHRIEVPLQSTLKRMLWEQISFPNEAKKLGIDLIHSPHYTMPLQASCRTVVTFHDMTFFSMPQVHGRFRRIFFRNMMRASSRTATRLLSNSECTRQDMCRLLHIPLEKVTLTPLAADKLFRKLESLQTAAICSRYGLISNQFLLFVGVLEPRKNIPSLLRAYARLAVDSPERPLVIVGKKGWMYERIFQTVQQLGLENKVIFTGYVPEEDLAGLYNGATLFIYPSQYEGFGLPVLEALQCGAPVITSNLSSLPEVAGDCAVYVSPKEDREIEGAMRLLIKDEGLANRLRRDGPIRAAGFSWELCAERTLEAYQAAMNGNNP